MVTPSSTCDDMMLQHSWKQILRKVKKAWAEPDVCNAIDHGHRNASQGRRWLPNTWHLAAPTYVGQDYRIAAS